MKRWIICIFLLLFVAVIAAGCGDSGDTASTSGGGTEKGGPVGQAEATSCSANRRMISSASQQYFAMEGAYPASIQVLVPEYLQSVPACPSAGIYTLQGNNVTCSIHGS